MLRHVNIIGSSGDDSMGCHLCFSVVVGLAVGIDHFAVLIVRNTDGAVIAPVPAFIGDDGFLFSVHIGDLHLCKQFGFGSVLVPDAPSTAASPVPSIRQLNGQGMLPCRQHFGHIKSLILNTLAVVRVTGCQHEVANPSPVHLCFVKTAGGDVQPGRLDFSGDREILTETINRIPLTFLDLVVSGDPLRLPVGSVHQSHFEEAMADFATLALFVPELDRPIHPLPGMQLRSAVRNVGHCRILHFAAIPDSFPVHLCNDLIGGLFDPTFAVPVQPGTFAVNANRIR